MKNFIIQTHDNIHVDALRKQLKNLNLKGVFQVKLYNLVIGSDTVSIYSTSGNLDSLGVEIKKIEKNQPQVLLEKNNERKETKKNIKIN